MTPAVSNRPSRPIRVLLHPGFHKTGTTSLQRSAELNQTLLEPHLRMLLPRDLAEPSSCAKTYSRKRERKVLTRFKRSFASALMPLDPSDHRPVLISCEHLAGMLPGRRDVWRYDATQRLVRTAVTAISDHFGPCRISVWFSTRETEAWMRSVYWQNLRAHRITDDFDTYRAALLPGADLPSVVKRIKRRLRGEAHVFRSDLDELSALGGGPLDKVLRILELPEIKMTLLPPQNPTPKGGTAHLLELNRSALSDEELSVVKRAYLDNIRVTNSALGTTPDLDGDDKPSR